MGLKRNDSNIKVLVIKKDQKKIYKKERVTDKERQKGDKYNILEL